MSRSEELRKEAAFVEEQEKLAEQALKRKGVLRKYWEAHYTAGARSKPVGTFVGLVCRNCNKWDDGPHGEACAVAELEQRANEPVYDAVKRLLIERGWLIDERAQEKKAGELREFCHADEREALAWIDALLAQHLRDPE